jgi:type I restriction enzyme S subunit
MPVDLEAGYAAEVRRILAEIAPDLEVWAFGSRVDGRAKPHSDLDLALVSPRRVPAARLAALADAFAESELPFRVDLVELAAADPGFREIIERSHEVIRTPDDP